jgi:UDP-3-O-acyl-N-acetylglucosamine deacetylase
MTDVNEKPGRIIGGDGEAIRRAYDAWRRQAVDREVAASQDTPAYAEHRTTLGGYVSVSGPGTYLRRQQQRLVFEPSEQSGWWFDREDLPASLRIRVAANNVWNTTRSIVLCSGSPHNYMRMVEHIVALRVGMGLDNVTVRLRSGDPPLFDRGSLDLVEAVEDAGIVPQNGPAPVVRVKEPVTIGGPHGSFLTLLPPAGGSRGLFVDCAVDFRSAIGKQRIRFPVNRDTFRHGAAARTNAPFPLVLYCKTIGLLFADTRNLGYTWRNILVAGRWRYLNRPRLIHNGKSLEAVWHRAALDLLAGIALIDRGRLAGSVISYKAGHALDVQMVATLYRQDLLETM